MLTNGQRAAARYTGGKDIANRKRNAAQDTYALRYLAENCRSRHGGAKAELSECRRAAIASLANVIASGDADPSDEAAVVLAELPAHAEKHAALIAEINTISVAQHLEQSNPKRSA